jgi:hypothetical protein
MFDQTSKRPLGLTLLSLLLAWCSFGALIVAFVTPTPIPHLPWTWYKLAAGAYALTGLPVAVGIWQRRPWAPTGFWIWSAAALIVGALPSLTMATRPLTNRWLVVPVVLVSAAILVWLGRYVRRSIQPAA